MARRPTSNPVSSGNPHSHPPANSHSIEGFWAIGIILRQIGKYSPHHHARISLVFYHFSAFSDIPNPLCHRQLHPNRIFLTLRGACVIGVQLSMVCPARSHASKLPKDNHRHYHRPINPRRLSIPAMFTCTRRGRNLPTSAEA